MIQYKNGDWKSFTIKQLWKGKLLMQKFGTEKFQGGEFCGISAQRRTGIWRSQKKYGGNGA